MNTVRLRVFPVKPYVGHLVVFTVIVVLAMSHDVDELQLDGKGQKVTSGRRFRRKVDDILTNTQRVDFVNAHNELRRKVSPAANNMIKMVWNGELESMAHSWAQHCSMTHGQPSRKSQPFDSIGQNLYITGGDVDVKSAVSMWYNEEVDYTFSAASCAKSKKCGHYTQVVWANSYAIGCAIAQCSYSNLVVCNYGPAGNYVGKQPYTSGGGNCSACPADKPTCDNGLCTTKTRCALVKECKPIDLATCLCDEFFYKELVSNKSSKYSSSFAAEVIVFLLAVALLFCR